MNRAAYMARLRELLSDITEAEREEALNYYEDYFDDAGVENEASVIASLGSPEKVAATIKDGLIDSDGTNGEYTENGYSDGTNSYKDEVVASTWNSKERRFGKKSGLGNGIWIVLLILCLFALPILGPITIGIVSAIFGILCAIACILFAVLLSGVGIVIAGVALVVAGIVTIFATPVVGVLLMGAGLIAAGIGILLAILGIWIVTKVIPPLVRGIVKICRRIFQGKRA